MAITKKFIESFTDFVEQYKIAAAGYSLGLTTVWTDTDYGLICTQLTALLIGIKADPDRFAEYEIIASLAIISAAKCNADSWFTSLFRNFMSKSNTESCDLAFAFSLSNQVQKAQPIDLVAGLQHAITQMKQSYETQLQVFQTQMDTITDENATLREELATLKSALTSAEIKLKRTKELIQETGNTLNLIAFQSPASSSAAPVSVPVSVPVTAPIATPVAVPVKPSINPLPLPVMFTPLVDVRKKAAPPPPPAPRPPSAPKAAASNQNLHFKELQTALKGRYVKPELSPEEKALLEEEKKNSAATSMAPS